MATKPVPGKRPTKSELPLPTDEVQEEEQDQQPEAAETTWMDVVTAQTPWWIVSALLHVLVIALIGLLSIQIEDKEPMAANMILQTVLVKNEITPGVEPPKQPSVLQGDKDVPPTDPDSKDPDDITVPKEILDKAVLGDHYETVNPDKPDTHSAFGNPDAHMFYAEHGNDEDAGGGKGDFALDTMIGVGGPSGSFGGGEGDGIGVDKGHGRGSFGSRTGGGRIWMVKRHGGMGTLDAVDLALKWLAYHQEADGHWDGIKYEASAEKNDTAITGLALLAFLGAGHTEKIGNYQKNVRSAVAWLKSRQGPDGQIFDSGVGSSKRGYHVAIAALAMAEAAGMEGVPDTVTSADKAIKYCTEVFQQGAGGGDRLGWRYEPNKDSDVSVTGWFIMAMKSAKIAGIKVNPAAVTGALNFLQKMERKGNADSAAYAPASQFAYSDKYEGITHRTSCIGTLCRQFLGWKKEDLQASVDAFVAKGGVPGWGADGETVDMYYWYYGSLCCFQQGGKIWDRWNEGMKKALLPNQCKQGDSAGSWNPRGDYSEYWGRVGQTALGALILEVYYRYKKLEGK